MAHLYIFGTIFFTVYGQLVIKWRIPFHGHLPDASAEKLFFLLKLFFRSIYFEWFCFRIHRLFVLDGGHDKVRTQLRLSIYGTHVCSRFLSLQSFLFSESVTVYKILGLALIVLGIFYLQSCLITAITSDKNH
ncbi:hypothetical protein Sdiek1_0353 [Sulfurospirillum diekertiae]|uniref:Uncharacterized protein n=1 Tax=Sulfurospirillum diekertiae TaxID=1854492 RepID=A0A1Y0HIW9_9BACT|nr:hypothetical protein [Sulfurospirillum diekertiae]ARU47536.1 hypothetical protein Sdiek1_0353 [Sulfurospirillum diekertiae]